MRKNVLPAQTNIINEVCLFVLVDIDFFSFQIHLQSMVGLIYFLLYNLWVVKRAGKCKYPFFNVLLPRFGFLQRRAKEKIVQKTSLFATTELDKL